MHSLRTKQSTLMAKKVKINIEIPPEDVSALAIVLGEWVECGVHTDRALLRRMLDLEEIFHKALLEVTFHNDGE